MVIGAQLYTVRDFTKNINDFEETLGKIADMGCRVIQVSGTCDFEAEWLAEKEKAAEVISRFAEANRGKTINFEDKARMHIHAGTLNRYVLQQEFNTFPIEVHNLRLGNIAFATNPFELFLDYGN